MPQRLAKNHCHTLSVFENVDFFGRLFGQDRAEREAGITDLLTATGLEKFRNRPAGKLSGGMKQKLGLCCALIHDPDLLILDEPTSGVDPVARDEFWRILADLSRKSGLTILVSTHFRNEAEWCDRISLMHAGEVLVSGTPANITRDRGCDTLEDAFISWLEEAAGDGDPPARAGTSVNAQPVVPPAGHTIQRLFDSRRMFSDAMRETMELRRDPIRATLAVLGLIILMAVIALGINMDVEDLTFAVLGHDDSTISRDYVPQIAGSRYFIEQEPLTSYADIDRRMDEGGLNLAPEIPPVLGRDLLRGRSVGIGGSDPMRAKTASGYVQGVHGHWMSQKLREQLGPAAVGGTYGLELR